MRINFISKYRVEGIEHYSTIMECYEYIQKLNMIGIDIETSRKYKKGEYDERVYKGGLDPYLTNVCMLQLGDDKETFVIDVRDFTSEEMSPITDFLHKNKDITLVGHNLRFEQVHLKHRYGIQFSNIWDTMLAEMCLFNGMTLRYGLADLAERYLGVQKVKAILLFEDTVNKQRLTMNEQHLEKHDSFFTPFEVADNFQLDKSTRMQFVTIGAKPFTEKQILYGADDIVMPLLIRQRQKVGRKLENGEVYNPSKWQKVENKYCLVLADMQLNGMNVRKDLWKELHDENHIIYLQRKKILDDYVVNSYGEKVSAQFNMFTMERDCPIQWSSSKQVVTFFKKLNICPRAYSSQTKQTEDTVGAVELLKTLPNPLKIAYERGKDTPIVDLDTLKLAYLLFKKSEQAITTFGEPWLKYVHPITGRAHSNYRQILNTARISSTAPNLNNISGGKWRDCFEVGEGLTMVNLDYSSQEVRVLAEVCHDETLMNFFIKGDETFGDDFHSFTATKVYSIMQNDPTFFVPPKEITVDGKKVDNKAFTHDHKDMRGNSKKVTFGLAYGKGIRGFMEDLGITEEEAEDLVAGYMGAFPGLQDHFDNCERNADIYDFVMINEKLDVRWFCDFFMDIKKYFAEAMAYFPPDYRQMRPSERTEFKKELYAANPQIKQLFSKAGRLKGSLGRKNKNYPIQGSSSMMLKIAMVMFREWCLDNDKDWKVIGNIYDEVLLEVKDEEAEEAGVVIKDFMEKGGTYICPTVPHIANYVLSKVWEH